VGLFFWGLCVSKAPHDCFTPRRDIRTHLLEDWQDR
jgi:hypothetical protein